MTARTPAKFGISAERMCFSIVRRRVTTLRLRSERFNVWRVRLAADLVLAIDYKNCGRGRPDGAYGLFLRARTVLGGYRALVQHGRHFIYRPHNRPARCVRLFAASLA